MGNILKLWKYKKKPGIHAFILPRQSGKTISIFKQLEPNDIYITPIHDNIYVYYHEMYNYNDISIANRNHVRTKNNINLYCCSDLDLVMIGKTIQKTLYLDEFLFFNDVINGIRMIIPHMSKDSNIIMLSSKDYHYIESLPNLIGYNNVHCNYNIVDGRKPTINIPDNFFEV